MEESAENEESVDAKKAKLDAEVNNIAAAFLEGGWQFVESVQYEQPPCAILKRIPRNELAGNTQCFSTFFVVFFDVYYTLFNTFFLSLKQKHFLELLLMGYGIS